MKSDYDYGGLLQRHDELKADFEAQNARWEAHTHMQNALVEALREMVELQRKYIARLEQ